MEQKGNGRGMKRRHGHGPITTWHAREGKASQEMGPQWLTCTRCGKECLAVVERGEATSYVCHNCRMAEGGVAGTPTETKEEEKKEAQEPSQEEEVSMRCLRHKKRFNVQRKWLETSQWLCPHCYSVVKETDRENFAPKNGIPPEVREAELDKPTCLPKELASAPKHKAEKRAGKEEPKQTSTETRRKRGRPKGIHTPIGQPATTPLAENPLFRGLLPRYSVECKHCGQTVPCHYSWFDNSTVLCPECYGKMGRTLIDLYHGKYKAMKPAYVEERLPHEVAPRRPKGPKRRSFVASDRWLTGWSNSRIRQATENELSFAVMTGEVSKVRANIELRRRKNAQYYEMLALPDKEKPLAKFF